jgi:hypothetical protein
MRLKAGRFLALGEGGRLARSILSGDGFKLYVHLCDLADTETGCLELYYSDVVREFKRCKKSIETDFLELRENGICVMRSAVNQHRKVQIEICDEFWDYIKRPRTSQMFLGSESDLQNRSKEGDANGSSIHESSELSRSEADDAHRAQAHAAHSALLKYGISPSEAERLIQEVPEEEVIDSIEYVAYISSLKGSSIRSPQSLLIHRLRNHIAVPDDFLTSRKGKALAEARDQEIRRQAEMQTLEIEYDAWCRAQAEAELNVRYSEEELNAQLAVLAQVAVRSDPVLARVRRTELPNVLRRKLIRDIRDELTLPSFGEWCQREESQKSINRPI